MFRQQGKIARQIFARGADVRSQRAAIKRNYDRFLAAIPACLGQNPVGKALDARARHVTLQFLDRPAVGECQFPRHDPREGDVLVERLTDVPGLAN